MPQAKVESVEAIKLFRRALFKFAEAANAALTDAEADAISTHRWLETEQRTFWTNNVRKSSELVSRCEEAVRHKKIFKDSSGRTASAVDEEKALAKAKRMKEIAEEKLEAVRRYTPRLQREIMLYKGQAQRLATFVAADIPTATHKLDKIVQTLESYLALGAAERPEMPMSLPTDDRAPAPTLPPNTGGGGAQDEFPLVVEQENRESSRNTGIGGEGHSSPPSPGTPGEGRGGGSAEDERKES